MIPALLMIMCISASTSESIFRKMFANRFGGKGTFLFNAFVTAAAGLFFALTSGGLQWEPGILPYVLLFSFCYATTSATYTLALSCGPLSLSTLIFSFSTILPTLYGLLLGESIRVSTFLPGLALLLISLFFTNKPEKNQKISLRWIIFLTIATITNGGCSIFQTMQQVAFHEQYKNELMTLSLALVTLFFLILAFFTGRKEIKSHLKCCWWQGTLAGICNAVLNLLVMVLRPILGASILFPLFSGGSLVLAFLVSTFLYKEKLSRWQFIGFVLGIGSVILLSV